MNFLKSIKKINKKIWIFLSIFSIIISILTFLFGPGILNKPKIVLVCGSSKYEIPLGFKMQNFILKLMMAPEELETKMFNELESTLKKYGFDEKKAKLVIDIMKKKDMEEGKKLNFKKHEINIIQLALSEISAEFIPKIFNERFDVPEGVLFFEIINNGKKAAHKVHISVKLKGSIYGQPSIESDAKLVNSFSEKSEISYECEILPPKSKIRGIIWYSPIVSINNRETHEIIVSFEEGSISQKIKENDIFAYKD